ncbi:hypothetical protein KUCAC02_037291 [Chaenocephalus aceratus]|nr:hypothetical protein KUCAC02_037291 [Chaenocephalus aceratus]
MEKLASRHALSELSNWTSLMEGVMEENQEDLKSAVGSHVIQEYLHKHKVQPICCQRVAISVSLSVLFASRRPQG